VKVVAAAGKFDILQVHDYNHPVTLKEQLASRRTQMLWGVNTASFLHVVAIYILFKNADLAARSSNGNPQDVFLWRGALPMGVVEVVYAVIAVVLILRFEQLRRRVRTQS
jgi:hypothetical protein